MLKWGQAIDKNTLRRCRWKLIKKEKQSLDPSPGDRQEEGSENPWALRHLGSLKSASSPTERPRSDLQSEFHWQSKN